MWGASGMSASGQGSASEWGSDCDSVYSEVEAFRNLLGWRLPSIQHVRAYMRANIVHLSSLYGCRVKRVQRH